MGGKVGPLGHARRNAGLAGAAGGHQQVEAVDPALRSGQGRDQPRIVGAAETVSPECGEPVVRDVWRHGEDGMRGEREDRFQPRPPGRYPPPAAVRVGEPPLRRGGDQPGQRVRPALCLRTGVARIRAHPAHRTHLDAGTRARPRPVGRTGPGSP